MPNRMKPGFLLALIAGACLATTLRADVLKIGCSDWPGSAALEIASEKGWFKEAGLEVEIVRAEYPSSIAAFAGTATDAVCIVGSDALVAGANGTKCRIIAAFDYSDGGDAIVGAPGVESIKDLKGRKVGVEVGFVGHLLLLQALRSSGMKQSDVELTIIPAKEAAQALTGGNVAAAALRQPTPSRSRPPNPAAMRRSRRPSQGRIFSRSARRRKRFEMRSASRSRRRTNSISRRSSTRRRRNPRRILLRASSRI